MDEDIYQIAEQIVQLHQKTYEVFCLWLKMCATEKYQKVNYHICQIVYWILCAIKKY